MLDVNQIMKDLASMVHEQGDTIGEVLIMCVHAWDVCVSMFKVGDYFVVN